MRKILYICMAALTMAACAGEIMPETDGNKESAPGRVFAAKAGEDIQITVTLPTVDGLETRVSLTENAEGGLEPAWEAGDMILVGGETFTLVSADGKTGTFSGKMPAGETFDIVYPAGAAAATSVQKADKDCSHIKYRAQMLGVDSIDDIHFGYDWAGAHGGTFVQSGALKIVLNLPSGTADVSKVTFSGEGLETVSVDVTDGAFTGNTFTAYLPCGEMELDRTRDVTIKVATVAEEELINTFRPGTQTLYEGYLVRLVTSDAKWQRKLTGKGSENDPYLVRNLEELLNVRNLVSLDTYTHFRMTTDIDMSSVTDWQPLNVENANYGIVFDGGNHKIIGFKCTHNSWGSFFGVLSGTVKNLTFEAPVLTTTSTSTCGIVAGWVGNRQSTLSGELNNVHVVGGKVSTSAYAHAGGLAGSSGSGKFVNCSFDGTLERTGSPAYTSDYHPIGGILGEALDGVSFTGCSTSGTLNSTGGRATGGIVGLCSKEMDITGCSSSMNITARDDVAGGIVGYYGTGTISDCHVTSNISVTSNGSGKSYTGGIAGHTSGSVLITGCSYSGGTISAYSQIVGGILGQCNANSGTGCTIEKCFSSGTLKGTYTMGGIIGCATEKGLSISDCGSTMDIKSSQAYVGGIAGDLPKNAKVRNCFSTGSVTGTFSLGGIAGRAFGRQASSASLDTDVNTAVEGCIAWNSSVQTTTSDGEDPANHYSGGAVIGCSSRPNTLKNCWRKRDMAFSFYKTASLNTLFDHADSSPANPLTQASGSAKWYSPYHGKAAASGATLSAVAQSAGWSSAIWDFSGDVPVLKK